MSKPIVIDQLLLTSLQEQYDTLVDIAPIDIPDRWIANMDASEYLGLFPDNSVDMVFTDEPFGIESSIIALRGRKPISKVFDWDGNLPSHLVIPWVFQAHRVLKDGGALVNCGLASWSTTFENVCQLAGLTLRANDVWIKTNPPTRVRHGGFRSAHEMIWIASKGSLRNRIKKEDQATLLNYKLQATCPNCSQHFPINMIRDATMRKREWARNQFNNLIHMAPFKHHKNRIGHETEKPDWMAFFYLWLLSDAGDLVVDPFCGSGRFIEIAAQLGRRISANDINERWSSSLEKRLDSLQEMI